MLWANWITVILGIWLIVAPFILRYTTNPVAMWTSIITGAIVAILAYLTTTEIRENHTGNE